MAGAAFYVALFLGTLVLFVEVDNGMGDPRNIPVAMFMKWNNASSTSELIDQLMRVEIPVNLVPPDYVRPPVGIDDVRPSKGPPGHNVDVIPPNETGHVQEAELPNDVKETFTTVMAVHAGCEPRPTPVPVPDHRDDNGLYIPFCVTLNRCGGCCGHRALECIATEVEFVNVNLAQCRYPFPGAAWFTIEDYDGVAMEQHSRCQCQCRVQPEDCNLEMYNYSPEACSCICKNAAAAVNCGINQMWEPHTCSCKCPQILWCPMDEYFSNDTCRCEHRPNVPAPTSAPDTGDDLIDPCKNKTCRHPFVARFAGGQCVCIYSPADADTYSNPRGSSRIPRAPQDWNRHPSNARAEARRYKRVPSHPLLYNQPKKRAADLILP